MRQSTRLLDLVFALLRFFLFSIAPISALAADEPPTTPTERAFLEAQTAWTKKDLLGVHIALPMASTDPLLGRYATTWYLRLLLAQAEATPLLSPLDLQASSLPNDTAPTDLDQQIQAFLRQDPNSLSSDLLRRDWLRHLGQREQWEQFDRVYPNWELKDDDETFCYAGLSHLAHHQPQKALEKLPSKKLGPACTKLATAAGLPREGIRARLLNAIEANTPDDIRTLAKALGFDSQLIEMAMEIPKAVLADPSSAQEMVLLAWARLAQENPGALAARLRSPSASDSTWDAHKALSQRSENEQAFVWAILAATSMQQLEPQSAVWAKHALQHLEPNEPTPDTAPANDPSELAPEIFPQVGDQTLGWLARAGLLINDWTLVHQATAHMSPIGKADPTWTYWDGRAQAALGAIDEAKKQWRRIAGQFHFYGQLAELALDGHPSDLPPEAPISRHLVQSISHRPGLLRAKKLYDLGLRKEANMEWNYALRRMSDPQLLASAQWACDNHIYDRCVNTAERTTNQHRFSLRFITPFFEEIEPVAQQHELDPAWVYGLIRQESRFIMNAHSSASAHGLMQIIPSTGKWIAKQLGDKNYRHSDLNRIEKNVQYGVFYLDHVLEKFDRALPIAAASYNAGPSRAKAWLAKLSTPIEGATFAEIIPFSETRDYVKKVLSNAAFYSSIIHDEQPSLLDMLGTVYPDSPEPKHWKTSYSP